MLGSAINKSALVLTAIKDKLWHVGTTCSADMTQQRCKKNVVGGDVIISCKYLHRRVRRAKTFDSVRGRISLWKFEEGYVFAWNGSWQLRQGTVDETWRMVTDHPDAPAGLRQLQQHSNEPGAGLLRRPERNTYLVYYNAIWASSPRGVLCRFYAMRVSNFFT